MLEQQKTSNSVIGPIDYSDWLTMQMLKGSIKILKERNTNGKYDLAINKESSLYKEFLDKYLKVA